MSAGRVLVTGATGLVGRHVADAFGEAGWQVLRLARREADILHDLGGPAELERSVPDRPDLIVHLAALVPGGGGQPDSVEAGDATRRMDDAVFRAAAGWKARLVYASSCGLYRRDLPARNDEASPVVDWKSPYFAAKLAGEKAALALGGIVLRISSPIAAGMPPHLVFPRFVALAAADSELRLFGDGSREQDFISAHDLAGAFVAAAGARSGIYNAARGMAVTMADLANCIVAALGSGRIVFSGNPEATNCLYARYDISRARHELAWQPEVSLEDMIAEVARKQMYRADQAGKA